MLGQVNAAEELRDVNRSKFSSGDKLITFAKRNNDNTIMLLLQSKTIISQLIELQ
ncbi:hypothetical protein [Anabaena sp. UHCC 0253]|uniref:hypothetical protein n=1 Tax=Anabaena sp. UHCC 0253 TaxID=2590019 RepID=UPI001445934B|nr:hypothetical protein [Anabaena sp. UHCC 0253]